MDYSTKLKNPKWQKKRLEILNRDNFTCQSCFDTETTLHVHHLHYFPNKEPWDISSDYLITLCENCHQWEEENYKERMDDLILILKSQRFLSHHIHALSNLIIECDLFCPHPDFRIISSLLMDKKRRLKIEKEIERKNQQFYDSRKTKNNE